MTPALRTAILDALMERWRENEDPEWLKLREASSRRIETWFEMERLSREHFSYWLDMILPIAEPMIREAALLEAAKFVLEKKGGLGSVNLAEAILALGEP